MSTNQMAQGTVAVIQGTKFERNIAAQLAAHDIEFEQKVRIDGGALWSDSYCVADFLLASIRQYPAGLYLSVKWQDRPGTAGYEKIPFEIARIKECFPLPCMIIVGGSKMERCISWALRQVDNKFVGIMDESQFTRWLMRNGFS